MRSKFKFDSALTRKTEVKASKTAEKLDIVTVYDNKGEILVFLALIINIEN